MQMENGSRGSRRWVVLTSLAGLTGAVMAACGSEAPAAPVSPTKAAGSAPSPASTAVPAATAKPAVAPTVEPSKSKPAVKISFWQYQDVPSTELFQKYVDAFNAEGRGSTIQHDRVDGAKKAPAAAANSMPDLDLSNPNHPAQFAARDGGMVALDTFIRKQGSDGIPQAEYLPAPWGLYTWKRKQYGIPLQAAIKNFIYNKEIFAEVGIAKLPTTWDDFVGAGKKIVQKEGTSWKRSFLNMNTDLNRPWHEFSYRNNTKRVTDDLTKSLVNSPESTQSLQYLIDLAHVHGLQPKPDEYAPETVDFTTGRSAVHWGGFQNATAILKANPALKLGTMLVPYGPTPAKVTGIAGECLAMWDSSKERDAAFQFIRYMCYDRNLAWCKDYFIIPVRKADLSDPYYQSDLMAPVVETLQSHVYLRWMYDLGNTFPHAAEFAAAITTACKEAYTLQKSVKQALDGAADAHNALLAQYAGELKQFLADQA